MPTYNGSTAELIQPRLKSKTYPEISDDVALEWISGLIEGLKADEALGINVENGDNLYFYNDYGLMERAVSVGDNINDPETARELMKKSMDGRLFTRELGASVPKQVVTEKTAPFDVAVTANEDLLSVPSPEFAAPKRPGFFKRLLAPIIKSFRKELDEYKRKQEEYLDLLTQSAWISKMSVSIGNVSKVLEDAAALDLETQAYQNREAEKNAKAEEKEAADKAKNAEVESFKSELEEAAKIASWAGQDSALLRENQNFMKLMAAEQPTADKIYDLLSAQLVREVARNILCGAEDEAVLRGKEASYSYLKQQEPLYRSAKQGIREAMPQLIGAKMQETIEKYAGGEKSKLSALMEQIPDFLRAGLLKYTEHVNQKNAERQAQNQIDQPKMQVQQPEMEVQKTNAKAGPDVG